MRKMNKIITICLLFSVLLLLIFIIPLKAVTFHMIFLGGFNISGQRDNLPSTGYIQIPNIGFTAGGGAEINFNPIAVEVDVMFEKKGTIKFSDKKFKDYRASNFYYLTIPIIIKWVNKYYKDAISYGIGPSIGSLLSAAAVYKTKDYKKNDIGIVGALGVKLSGFIMELRVNYGLTNIIDTGNSDNYIKNINCCYMMGVKI